MDYLPYKRDRSCETAHQPRRGRCVRAQLRHFVLKLFALLSLVSVAPSVLGAAQGTTGTTSTGNVDIFYVQGLQARINGFADMPLGTWSGSGPMTANDNICVGRTGVPLFSGGGTYAILASGDGEPGNPAAFTLTNGITQISYNAFFNDAAGTAGRQQLTPGVVLTGQTGFGLWYFFNMIFNCAVANANLSIEVPETELQGAAGNYVGTLTLTLIPQ